MLKKPSVDEILKTDLKSPIKCKEPRLCRLKNSIIAGSFLFNYVHGFLYEGDLDIFMTDFDIKLNENGTEDIAEAICDIVNKITFHQSCISKDYVQKNLSTYSMSCSKYALSFNSRTEFMNVFGEMLELSPALDKIQRVQLVFYKNDVKISTMDLNQRKSSIVKNFDFLHCMPYFDIDKQQWYTNNTLNKIIEEKILVFSPKRMMMNAESKERYFKFIKRGFTPSHRTQKLMKL